MLRDECGSGFGIVGIRVEYYGIMVCLKLYDGRLFVFFQFSEQ